MSLKGLYLFSFVIILSAFCLIGCGPEQPPSKPVPKPPVKSPLPEKGPSGNTIR